MGQTPNPNLTISQGYSAHTGHIIIIMLEFWNKDIATEHYEMMSIIFVKSTICAFYEFRYNIRSDSTVVEFCQHIVTDGIANA